MDITPLFDPQPILNAYLQQQYPEVSEALLNASVDLDKATDSLLTPDLQNELNRYVGTLLYLFSQPDYQLTLDHAQKFLAINPLLANLICLSDYKSADPTLTLLLRQPEYIAKFLILFSARSQLEINYDHLFSLHPQLACQWYSHYFGLYAAGLVNPTVQANLQRHLLYEDSRIDNYYNLSCIYFGATYIDGDHDCIIKQKINQLIQNGGHVKNAAIHNTPDPTKIAVVTSRWHTGHSVYRTLSQYVDALRPDYDITLIYTGPIERELPIAPFSQIKVIYLQAGAMPLQSIQTNDFAAVYYPDIGMSEESIILSNLRLAPVQLCGTGHPTTTSGSEIDYFISGIDVESPEHTTNYSERLVLLPGFGCIHNPPTYTLQRPAKSRPEFLINCSWASPKTNYRTLACLRQIIDQANQPVVFRLFTSGIIANSNLAAFRQDVTDILGAAHVEILPGKAYDDYMSLMEEGDLILDPVHFGGSNIVSDSLHLRKLVVAVEGDKWYSRIGACMLRMVGLEELVAANLEAYVEITLRLIQDSAYRAKCQQRLDQADLAATIFSAAAQPYFKTALDYLIQNHATLQADPKPRPVVITA
jgi:hypothetical protein